MRKRLGLLDESHPQSSTVFSPACAVQFTFEHHPNDTRFRSQVATFSAISDLVKREICDRMPAVVSQSTKNTRCFDPNALYCDQVDCKCNSIACPVRPAPIGRGPLHAARPPPHPGHVLPERHLLRQQPVGRERAVS